MTSIKNKEEILLIIIINYLELSSQDIYLVRCDTQCHFEKYLTCKCKG